MQYFYKENMFSSRSRLKTDFCRGIPWLPPFPPSWLLADPIVEPCIENLFKIIFCLLSEPCKLTVVYQKQSTYPSKHVSGLNMSTAWRDIWWCMNRAGAAVAQRPVAEDNWVRTLGWPLIKQLNISSSIFSSAHNFFSFFTLCYWLHFFHSLLAK